MRAWIVVLLAWLGLAGTAFADKRVALIVGNGAYEHADVLANPVNDARNMRKALSKLGFADEDIVYGEDLKKRDLERAIGKFAHVAGDADVAMYTIPAMGRLSPTFPTSCRPTRGSRRWRKCRMN